MVMFKELSLIDMMDCRVSDQNLSNPISCAFLFMLPCISSCPDDWTEPDKTRQQED